MAHLTIVDFACEYVCPPEGLDDDERLHRVEMLTRRADEIANLVGSTNFAELCAKPGAVRMIRAVQIAERKIAELVSEQSLKTASTYAVVILMIFNIIRDLKDDPAARIAAEAGELMYFGARPSDDTPVPPPTDDELRQRSASLRERLQRATQGQ